MKNLSVKYASIVGTTMLAFVHFIACGAQLYQVSLDGDHDQMQVPQHAKSQESKYYGLHATDGWQSIPIRFVVSSEMSEEQIAGLNAAMGIWEQAVGKKLFKFEGKDVKTGDSFNDLYSSLTDYRNGHYIDHDWLKTGKSNMVLATTIWDTNAKNPDQIVTADIRFNGEYYVIGDSFEMLKDENDEREIVDMTTLALHEIGHMLGLTHVEKEYDRLSIMNPTIYIGEGLANRHLSCGDIARIQKIYGCGGAACDQEATCRRLGGEVVDGAY